MNTFGPELLMLSIVIAGQIATLWMLQKTLNVVVAGQIATLWKLQKTLGVLARTDGEPGD